MGVGADHYYKIVNPFKLPIQRLGMFLTFDCFGRNFLFGRIPGSNLDKKQQQVNFVTIQNVRCNSSLNGHISKPNLTEHINSPCVNDCVISNLPILNNSEFVNKN